MTASIHAARPIQGVRVGIYRSFLGKSFGSAWAAPLSQAAALGALERDQSGGCRFLLVFAPWRPGRPPERGESCVKSRASHAEQLRGVIERRLVGERGEFQITGARARNEHVAKQLAFGFVHANVDGEDLVGAPVWHAGSDEHRAAAQLVACLGDAPRSLAYAARR